jgi:hypothetical protein
VWDLDLQADFVDNTTNNAHYLPNRVIFTTPENLQVGTISETEMDLLDLFYEKKDRKNYLDFSFTIDAKLIREYLCVVAY